MPSPPMLSFTPTVSISISSKIRFPDKSLFIVIGRELEFFSQAGFDMDKIYLKRNAPVAQLYEDAIRNEGAILSSSGALINFSGKKTGRSPKDKRIVYEDTSKDDIWWGSVNIKLDEHTFEINRERAIDYLNTRDNVYVFDGFAGVSFDVSSAPAHNAPNIVLVGS
ncbi:phosphoenolpyruvate carboxykinase [Lentinula edodes]|uniref:phosphoenolpyruvate carboxykinase n=1 Tax=Lentinula edodes TaxID=5353 RepID=UPI001E8CF5EA|nr:phosphoenolpyruvate carboxykinase [Lentinula edodes]KAH7875068.1 phosphoenolpyruvate carboxykinase [Lentinula edodes]